MEFEELRTRIGALRGSIRRLFLLDGIGRLLLVASGAVLFLFLVDYTLILPAAARTVLFLVSLAVLIRAFNRYFAFPLRTPLSDDEMLLCVERAHPELKECLISAYQFNRDDDPTTRRVMSPALVQSTIRHALAAASSLSFTSFLSAKRSLRRFLLGGVVVTVLIILGATHPQTSAIFLDRVYGGSTPWPARSHIVVESPEAEHLRISAGEDLQVKVRILGEVPSRVWILYEFPEMDEDGEARMTRVGEDAFQFLFPRLLTPLKCRIEAGDAAPKSFRVDVLQPPRVSSVRLWLHPPPYTKLSPTPDDAPLLDGNIRAPVGSRARLRVEVTKPIRDARMVYQQPPGKFLDMPILSSQIVEAEFDVEQNGRYALKLRDTEDLENRTPSRFVIRAMKDRRPRITVLRPEATSFWITPQASVPFEIAVKDDYGVSTVRLSLVRGSREHEGHVVPLTPLRAPADEAEGKWGPETAEFETTVDFSTLEVPGEEEKRKIAEGDLVLVHVEATDHRQPKPNRSNSAEYRLTVVSRGKLERLVEDRMIQLKDLLRKAKDVQEKVRLSAFEVRGVLEAEAAWDSADLEKLLGCQTGQRTVSQKLGNAAREFGRILTLVEINKLGDPEYKRKIGDMGGITRHLARERCPDALAALEFARTAPGNEGQRRGLSEALQIQADIIQVLSDLLERMEKWEDYNEVIKIVRGIRDMEQDLLKETLDEAKEKEKQSKEDKKDEEKKKKK
ncbi:MAG: hypothetical protein ACYS47_11245 [Planctomycetota bacterium]|jgi:hypothetical protein